MKTLPVDTSYIGDTLMRLLHIPSPTGYTDSIVHFACAQLDRLHIPYELTRRGAIRATLKGRRESPDRALVAHLDTLGAMVKALKENGRLEVIPVGHWNARFAEGARVTVFTDAGAYRGSILPLKASGHTFHREIDTQPSAWDNLEVRVDSDCATRADLMRHGIHVGDFISVDPNPEMLDNGYIISRHLDDKAGVAITLAAAKSIVESEVALPVDCHLLFTISEEVGSGASAVLQQDVAEMVTIDNGTTAPGQNSSEHGATIAMADSSGPYDYHLTQRLLDLCREFDIPHQRDVFKYYHSDSAAATAAGNDLRTALICFGIDGSHGWERIHMSALTSLVQLVTYYVQSRPLYMRDRFELGPLPGFPTQPS